MLFILVVFLILMLSVTFWISSLFLASATGAPSVFANRSAVEDALKLANLRRGETIIDVGCGDARSLIIASEKFGAIGIGIERSLYCYWRARWTVFRSGQKNIRIVFGNFFKKAELIKQADVVYMYLLNSVLQENEEWIFDNTRKDTRIVSLCFYFLKHKEKASVETQNLGRKTKVRLY